MYVIEKGPMLCVYNDDGFYVRGILKPNTVIRWSQSDSMICLFHESGYVERHKIVDGKLY